MDKWQAVERLLDAVPEFAPAYRGSAGSPECGGDGDLLLHVVIDDLRHFYMQGARSDAELASRCRRVVEELAASGDEAVRNAVHQRFARGDGDLQAALVEAEPLQGMATWRTVQAFRPRSLGTRRSDRRRERRARGRSG